MIGIVHYINITLLPTTLGTTSGDGARTTTASQDSTIANHLQAVQQPIIDSQTTQGITNNTVKMDAHSSIWQIISTV